MESLGNKITALRKKSNVTQDELAAALDVTRQAVSQWEQDLSTPKADKLKALCEYFNVRPDYFLFENGEMQPLVTQQEELAATSTAQPQKKTRKQIALTVSAIILTVLVVVCAVFSFSWYFIISSCIGDANADVGLYYEIEDKQAMNDNNGYVQILN